MASENTTSQIHRKTNDLISVLLIALILICLLILIANVFFWLMRDDRLSVGTSLFSGTGITGAMLLYYKWDIILRSKLNSTDADGLSKLLNNQKD
jgi:hypothetical protein